VCVYMYVCVVCLRAVGMNSKNNDKRKVVFYDAKEEKAKRARRGESLKDRELLQFAEAELSRALRAFDERFPDEPEEEFLAKLSAVCMAAANAATLSFSPASPRSAVLTTSQGFSFSTTSPSSATTTHGVSAAFSAAPPSPSYAPTLPSYAPTSPSRYQYTGDSFFSPTSPTPADNEPSYSPTSPIALGAISSVERTLTSAWSSLSKGSRVETGLSAVINNSVPKAAAAASKVDDDNEDEDTDDDDDNKIVDPVAHRDPNIKPHCIANMHNTKYCSNCRESVCTMCAVDCAGWYTKHDCKALFCFKCAASDQVKKLVACSNKGKGCVASSKSLKVKKGNDYGKGFECVQKFAGFCMECRERCSWCGVQYCVQCIDNLGDTQWMSHCDCAEVCNVKGHSTCFVSCTICNKKMSKGCARTFDKDTFLCDRTECYNAEHEKNK